jgi:uncharacterized protein (DUF433 family)
MGIDATFWSDCPAVEVVAERMHGVPVVKGTRMPADDVVENYETGSPVEEIADNFALDPKDIRTILKYAATHKPAQLVR